MKADDDTGRNRRERILQRAAERDAGTTASTRGQQVRQHREAGREAGREYRTGQPAEAPDESAMPTQELWERLKAARTQRDRLKQDVAQLRIDLARAAPDRKALTAERDRLQKKLQEVTAKLEEAKTRETRLIRDHERLFADHSARQAELTAAMERITTLEQVVQKLETTLASAPVQPAPTVTMTPDLQIFELKNSLGCAQRDLAAMRAQLRPLQDKEAALNGEIAELRAALARFTS